MPLLPYFFPIRVGDALLLSAGLSVVTLTVFGAVKARFTGLSLRRGALETMVLGGLAAGVAYAIARAISTLAGV